MENEVLHSQTQLLRQRRDHFLKKFRRAEDGLADMADEREIELEEHAQEEQSALFLIRHDAIALAAVKEIDAALQRIIDGTYGKCERCRKPISIRRLRSLPAARFCRGCAARGERRPATAPVAFGAPAEAPTPPGLNLLTIRVESPRQDFSRSE